MSKKTRGGGSNRTSPIKKVVQEPLHKSRRPTRKLKLSSEASEAVTSEGGRSIAQFVEDKYVKAVKKMLELSKDLEQPTVSQASEVLKTHMKVKLEQGTSEADVSALGNIAHTSLSEPINLDSPPHTSSPIDDLR